MRNIFKTILGVTAAAVMFTSCKKETETLKSDSDYFPLKIGKHILYEVDSVVYDDLNHTTYHNRYQMRYDVVDSFRDATNRLSYTINVYERPNIDSIFKPRDVIHITKTENGLEWTQSNIKLLKLVFPITEDHWNGLSYVTIDPANTDLYQYDISKYMWDFKYSNRGNTFDPGNNPFYNTVTVTGVDDGIDNTSDSSAISDRNFYQEVYAPNIGLVYRECIYWVYQPNVGYRKGFELRMRAVSQN